MWGITGLRMLVSRRRRRRRHRPSAISFMFMTMRKAMFPRVVFSSFAYCTALH